MGLRLVHPGKSFPAVRVALIVGLTLLLSGWTTCSVMGLFDSCQGSIPQPQITAIDPGTIPWDMESVLLNVNGSGFVPHSQILWNGNAVPTTFLDSGHLQTAVTKETFESFGGSAGSDVQISVRSEGLAPVVGCPNGGNSATLVLVID
jgi:hypothetical protein